MPSEIDQFVTNATLKNSYLILNNVPQWLKRLRKNSDRRDRRQLGLKPIVDSARLTRALKRRSSTVHPAFPSFSATSKADIQSKAVIAARKNLCAGSSFAPSGLGLFFHLPPTACAVGCILTPLAAKICALVPLDFQIRSSHTDAETLRHPKRWTDRLLRSLCKPRPFKSGSRRQFSSSPRSRDRDRRTPPDWYEVASRSPLYCLRGRAW